MAAIVTDHVILLADTEMRPAGARRNSFYVLMDIVKLFTAINCTFNFFIFYYHGTNFRTTVKAMLCRC
nr:hypothetical protein BaRGS_005201 [Batillaria attramentaria]